MSNESSHRVAVVGAGLAGLTAAHRLNQLGVEVFLYEKDGRIGGRAKTVTKEGFHLNIGPHALYRGGLAYAYLSKNRIPISGAEPKLSTGLAVYGHKLFKLPFSLHTIASTEYMNWMDKLEFGRVMHSLPRLDLSKMMDITVKDWLRQNLNRPKVRETLEAYVRLSSYSDHPEIMSAGAAFRQLVQAQQGVLYLDDGWQTIADGLYKSLANKVHFHFNASIQSITSMPHGVEIMLNGRREIFDAAIVCIPPHEVNKLIPGAMSDIQLQPSEAACLDVCLKKLPNGDRTFALGIDEPLYFSVHSNAARLAPQGGAVIHLAYYLNKETASENNEERLLRLLDQLQPGWRAELVYKRFLPHMVVSFGIPQASQNGAQPLSSPKLPKLPNIYVSGDYVGRDGLLADCAVSSALEAVDLQQKTTPVRFLETWSSR